MYGIRVKGKDIQYEVIEKEGRFEVRQYKPQIVAETIVDADFGYAGEIAFRRLFRYISGENRRKESIAMTAPVNQQKSEGNYIVNFLMPSKYTMETLPEPLTQRLATFLDHNMSLNKRRIHTRRNLSFVLGKTL